MGELRHPRLDSRPKDHRRTGQVKIFERCRRILQVVVLANGSARNPIVQKMILEISKRAATHQIHLSSRSYRLFGLGSL